MLEKLFSVLPEWVKQKLIIRMVYTAGSFLTARVVAFLMGAPLKHALDVAMIALAKVGVVIQVQVVSINEKTLEACITGALMIAGEWIIQHVHDNHVKPIVVEQTSKPSGVVEPSAEIDRGTN